MLTVDYKAIGQRIRSARRAAELTQRELAARIGLSQSALGLIERGKKSSTATYLRLCDEFHFTMDYLLFGRGAFQEKQKEEAQRQVREALAALLAATRAVEKLKL